MNTINPSSRGLWHVAAVVFLASSITAVAQAPANDNVANAIAIAALPFSGPGTTVDATTEASEPNHANDDFGNIASNSTWWSLVAPADTTISVLVDATGSFDSALAVYEGNPLVVAPTVVASADIVDATGNESVTFSATFGETYFIAVDGYSDNGTVQSAGAFTLEVEAVAIPDNDNFANARTIGPAVPANDSGTNIAASVEAGEPNHANVPGGNIASDSVWWNWVAPSSGDFAVWVQGAQLDGVIGVYTGNSVNALTPVGSGDRFLVGGSEEAVFSATAGTTYRIAIDAYSASGDPSPDTGAFEVVVIDLPGNDDFADATDLGVQFPILGLAGSTIGATEEAISGEPEHTNISGIPNLNVASNSVWYCWTSSIDGTVRVTAANATFDNCVAIYTGTALNNLVEVGSADVAGGTFGERAYFEATQGVEYFIAVDGFAFNNNRAAFQSGQFELFIETAPPNDEVGNAQAITDPLPVTTPGTTVNGTEQFGFGEPDHALAVAGNLASNTVWYTWTAPGAMPTTVTVENAGFDAVLAVYTGTPFNALTLVAESDDFFLDDDETVTFDAIGGTTYLIVVDGYSASGAVENEGSFDLLISEPPPPSPYDNWIALFPALTGADALRTANPSGDGIPNILKLVFGLNPTIPVWQDPSEGNAPVLTTHNGNPAIRYTVVPANLGTGPDAITHSGETSGELSDWMAAAPVNTVGNTWVLELPPGAPGGVLFGRIVALDPNAP